MTRFKVMGDYTSLELEDRLNDWAGGLPEGTKVRRTQLAAAVDSTGRPVIYALVSYELPPEPQVPDRRCPKCDLAMFGDSPAPCPRCGCTVVPR